MPADSATVDPRPSRRDPFTLPEVPTNLRKSSVRGASLMSASRIFNMALRFCATGVLARLLTQGDFGLWTMTAVISGFFAMFMDVGLTQATIQRAQIHHRQISTLFWINVGLGVLIAAIFALCAPWIAAFYGEPSLVGMIQVLALSFVAGGLGVQHQALLTRNMRFKLLAATDVFSMLAGIAVGVGMGLAGMGYWALVGMAVAAAAAKTAGLWLALRWIPGLPARGTGVGEMLKFGGDVFAFSLVNYFSRQADTILIGKFCGKAPVALYEKAYSLLLMPVSQINGPLASVVVPALSRLQGEPDRFRRYYLNAIQVVCSFAIPVIAGITLFADQVVLVWLGRNWAESAELFRLLALAALIGGISNPVGWLLISLGLTKRYRTLGFVNSAVIVLAFVIGLFFGPKDAGGEYSAHGVAIAYSLAMALNFVPFWWAALRGTPVKLGQVLRTMAVPALACIPAAAAAWVLKSRAAGGIDDWLPILAAMATFGGVYAAVLLFGFKKLEFFRNIAGEFRSR